LIFIISALATRIPSADAAGIQGLPAEFPTDLRFSVELELIKKSHFLNQISWAITPALAEPNPRDTTQTSFSFSVEQCQNFLLPLCYPMSGHVAVYGRISELDSSNNSTLARTEGATLARR
jgi:hypothetical protein